MYEVLPPHGGLNPAESLLQGGTYFCITPSRGFESFGHWKDLEEKLSITPSRGFDSSGTASDSSITRIRGFDSSSSLYVRSTLLLLQSYSSIRGVVRFRPTLPTRTGGSWAGG